MSNGFFNVPNFTCEKVKSYIEGSKERKELLSEYDRMYNCEIDIPMYIGDKEIFTKDKRK